MLRKHRESLRSDDSGMTLIELLVAISILAILMAMISTLGTKAFRTTSKVVSTTQTEGYYQNAMRRITRQLRYAAGPDSSTCAFDTVDGTQVIFYTYSLLGAVATAIPNKVRIWVDTSGTVWEAVTSPVTTNGVTTYTSTPLTTQLATGVVNTTAAPVFTWYDSADLTTANVVAPGTGMSLAQRQSLHRVSVTLQNTTNTVISVQQTVVFQNLL